MSTNPYVKRPLTPKPLSYKQILERAAKRGDNIAKEELEWRKQKTKALNSPKRYTVRFKNKFY
tara:strand:- start:6138 stop:6326 length:189 start_codon:yes stop_codon:yes gene_type:complete